MSTSVAPSGPQTLAWDNYTLPDLQHRTHGFEAATAQLRGYEPDLIPGQVQTRDYATAVLRVCQQLSGRPADENQIEAAVEARMARRSDWRARGGHAHFLVGEQALYTTIGGAEVMVAQLQALRQVLEEPDPIEVFILPRDTEFVAPATNFLFYDRSRVTVETATCQVIITDPKGLAWYETVFERLAAQTSSYHAGLNLLTAALDHHRTSAARGE